MQGATSTKDGRGPDHVDTAVTTESKSSIWKPLGDDEIRLLSLRHGVSSYLECDLEIVKIPVENQGDYSALSYTWGLPTDEKRAVPIQINGDVTTVRPNLHAALIAIWSQDARIKIWADALSIDQSNNSERSKQVSLMSTIFGRARTVLVWLGKLAPLDSEPMRRAWEVIEAIKSDPDRSLADIAQAIFPEDYKWRPSLINSLQLLSGKEWFYRAWIAQEILLAQSAEVRLGHLRMKWESFEEGCRTLVNNLGVQALLQKPWDEIEHCRQLIRHTTPTMTSLLVATYRRKATDPRDKIFALIGLLPDASYYADYTEDRQDAFLRVVEHCLTHDKSLMILELAQGFQPAWDCSEVDEELPEWAMISTNSNNGNPKYYVSTQEQYENYYWSDFLQDHPWDRKLLSWCPDFDNMEILSKRVISRFNTRLIPHHKPPMIIKTHRKESIGLAGYVLGAIYQCNDADFPHDRKECWKLTTISHTDELIKTMTVSLRYTLKQSFQPAAREEDNADVLAALKGWWSRPVALYNSNPFHDRSGREVSTGAAMKHIRSGMPAQAYDGDWVCILPGADKLCILRPYVREIVNDISLNNFLGDRKTRFRLEKFRFMGMLQSEICDDLTDDWLNIPLVWANFMLI